jgi:hypothetical protein
VPRNSISRRVARAASIGGSRSYRQRTPLGWYTILLAVCIIGLGLIVFSRHEREVASQTASTTTTTTQANATPPLISSHWQVALSVDVCGTVSNLPASANKTSGIITDGNGVVDIEPARAGSDAKQFEGANATLGKFLTAEGVSLSATSMRLPKSVGKLAGTYADGRKCGTKPASLQLVSWQSASSTTSFSGQPDPGVTYGNGELFMLAFVTKGASVPKPPAAHLVAAFVKSQTTTTTTTTTTIKGATTTTLKGATTTTLKGATTTTLKGATTTTLKGATTTTTSRSTTTTSASSTTTTTG